MRMILLTNKLMFISKGLNNGVLKKENFLRKLAVGEGRGGLKEREWAVRG